MVSKRKRGAPKKSASHVKGWETRRKNARAAARKAVALRKKRHDAGVRGWVTRRRREAERVIEARGQDRDTSPFLPGAGEYPAGTEMELSVRYSPQGPRDPILYIKIRIVLRVPMTKGEAEKRLRRSMHSNIVAPGIDLGWINWQKERGASYYREGEYIGARALQALKDFHAVIAASGYRRFGIVGEEDIDFGY